MIYIEHGAHPPPMILLCRALMYFYCCIFNLCVHPVLLGLYYYFYCCYLLRSLIMPFAQTHFSIADAGLLLDLSRRN